MKITEIRKKKDESYNVLNLLNILLFFNFVYNTWFNRNQNSMDDDRNNNKIIIFFFKVSIIKGFYYESYIKLKNFIAFSIINVIRKLRLNQNQHNAKLAEWRQKAKEKNIERRNLKD